jgi:hypothetical protein
MHNINFKNNGTMQQKEEMYQEGMTGGGAGSAQPSASENEKSYGWAKWVAFGIIISALAVGLVLTFIK